MLTSIGSSPSSLIEFNSFLKIFFVIFFGLYNPNEMKKLSILVCIPKFFDSNILSQASTRITGIFLFSFIILIANE